MQSIIAGFLSGQVKITKLADHTTAATDPVESAVLDTDGFDAVLFLTSFGAADPGNLITVHGAAASGGPFAATAATASAGASDEDVLIDLHLPTARYLKLVATRGASTTLESVWAIQYHPRKSGSTNVVAGTSAVGQFIGPPLA